MAVLTSAYWQSHFACDPAVLNQQVQIGGKPFTIVGVVQYRGLNDGNTPALYVPLATQPVILPGYPERLSDPLERWMVLMGGLLRELRERKPMPS